MKLKDVPAFSFFKLDKTYRYLTNKYIDPEDYTKDKLLFKLNSHYRTAYVLLFDYTGVPVGEPISCGIDDEVTIITEVPEHILNSFN